MIWSAALTLEVLSSLTDTVPDLSPSRLCITEPSAPTVILLRSPAGRDGDAALFDTGLVSGEGDVAARPVDGSLHIEKAIRMSHGFPSSISG